MKIAGHLLYANVPNTLYIIIVIPILAIYTLGHRGYLNKTGCSLIGTFKLKDEMETLNKILIIMREP